MDPYLGEIRIFAGSFAPKHWAMCEGQILAISQNTALFSLFGTMYGGDGRTTFALPNLKGQTPMSMGQMPGGSNRTQGEVGGSPTVTLTQDQLGVHNHSFTGQQSEADASTPVNNYVAVNRDTNPYTSPSAPGLIVQPMGAGAVMTTGDGLPHNNMQPFLGLYFIVALQGIFPPRS